MNVERRRVLGVNWELKLSQHLRRDPRDREPRVSKASASIELEAEPPTDRVERPPEREGDEHASATPEDAKERDDPILKGDLQLFNEPPPETAPIQLVTDAREGDRCAYIDELGEPMSERPLTARLHL